MQQLRKLDIFPKFDSRFEQEARQKTAVGAFLSLGAGLLVVLLAVGELRYFLSVENRHELYVDHTPVTTMMDIHVNVTFHHTPCDLISIDAVDAFGEFQKNLDEKSDKTRLDRDGRAIGPANDLSHSGAKTTARSEPTGEDDNDNGSDSAPSGNGRGGVVKKKCLSCFGAENYKGQCCNTCSELQAAYLARQWRFDIHDLAFVQCAKERLEQASRLAGQEGCNIAATLTVKRVQGNIHFIPGHSFKHLGAHLHDIDVPELHGLNLSHTINSMSFGTPFPGLVSPLEGETRLSIIPEETSEHKEKVKQNKKRRDEEKKDAGPLAFLLRGGAGGAPEEDDDEGQPIGGGRFQYFVKVVPTRYQKLSGEVVETNQYAVTEHYVPVKTGPKFIPGLFFVYDLSPLMVHNYEARPYASVAHFLLELCAIVGGVLTVAGLVDATVHHGAKRMREKMQLGKLS